MAAVCAAALCLQQKCVHTANSSVLVDDCSLASVLQPASFQVVGQRIRGVSDASCRGRWRSRLFALSAHKQPAWEWHCSRWCSTLAEFAFVSFETGRTTAVASARQNGCIPALLLLKKQCSLQRAARRDAGAKGQPLCPAVARETRHRRDESHRCTLHQQDAVDATR